VKCQSWVDPERFNKKGKPSPRSVVGTYRLDWDHYLTLVKGTWLEKRKALRERAVRCGGHLVFSMYADCGEGSNNAVEIDLHCENCGEYVHSVGLNVEVVEQWIQERLDSL
jgi:hypothetical protein